MPSARPGNTCTLPHSAVLSLVVMAALGVAAATAQELPLPLPMSPAQPPPPAEPAPSEATAAEQPEAPDQGAPAPGEEEPAPGDTVPAEPAAEPAPDVEGTEPPPEEPSPAEAAPTPSRDERIEQSLSEFVTARAGAEGATDRRHSAQDVVRQARLGVAQISTKLSAATLRVSELKSEHDRLAVEVSAYPRAVVRGTRSLEQAKTRLDELIERQTEYDKLQEELSATRQSRAAQTEQYAREAIQTRARLAAYAGDSTVRSALQKLDERAAISAELGDQWAEATKWAGENAELSAEAIAAIQQVILTAPQRRLLYRTAVRPSLAALGTATSELSALLAAAWASDADLEASPLAGWIWELVLLIGAVVGALLILFVLTPWVRKRWLRDLVGCDDPQSATLTTRDRVLALLLHRSLALAAVAGAACLAELTPAAAQFWVSVAAAWLGYATLGPLFRMLPASLWEDDQQRAAWSRLRRRAIALAAVCALFLPVIAGLKRVGYEHEAVVMLVEAVFAAIAALIVIDTCRRPGAASLLRRCSTPLAAWLAARPVTVRFTAIAIAVALAALHLLGWANLARYAARVIPLTVAVVVAVLCAADTLRRRRPEEPPEQEDAPCWVRWSAVAQWALLCIVAVALLLWVWGVKAHHTDRMLTALAAPVISAQGARLSVASIAKGVLSGLLLMCLGRTVRRWLDRARFLQRFDQGARYAIATTTYYLILTGAVLVAVVQMGFDLSVLTVFAGVAGVAVGFGSQDIAKNFIGGIIILLDRTINVGDYVILGATEGTITDISIRSTTLRTPDDQMVIVPNGTLVLQQFVNASLGEGTIRLALDVAVAPDADPDVVTGILQTAARTHPDVLADPPPEVWMSKLAAASLNFQLVVWTQRVDAQAEITGQLTARVWRELHDREIALV